MQPANWRACTPSGGRNAAAWPSLVFGVGEWPERTRSLLVAYRKAEIQILM